MQTPCQSLYLKRDLGTDFLLGFLQNFLKHLFYRTSLGEYFWIFRSLPKNDTNWGNNNFNANTEHTIFCCNNFEAAFEIDLSKSWKFLKEMSVVGFRYSKIIVFEIDSNFIYVGISRSWVFFKIDVLKNWLTKLQLYSKKIPIQLFSCEVTKVLKNTLFTEHLQWLHLLFWKLESGETLFVSLL